MVPENHIQVNEFKPRPGVKYKDKHRLVKLITYCRFSPSFSKGEQTSSSSSA